MAAPVVFVVDDDVIVREALAIALGRHGYEVIAPTDLAPDAIIAAAREAGPDVVLLDHFLGTGLGHDLIRPLVEATGATVLLLTGTDDPEVLGSSLEQGAAGTLLKRQPMQDLLDSIALALSGHTVQRPEERDELIASARSSRQERAEALAPFAELTPREVSVLGGMLDGFSAEQIAERDFVSLATVRTQIQSVLRKLGVTSQLAAVAAARRAGWRPDA
ncbi:MAG: response regulator containing a CheY-like receiver domain and an DNA-binding domain [Actinomycetia bacterium]|nr:response regulator containing a CheY-like receiver domain and an DNA-binding domain [Actinomycetes bacterium]